MTEREFWVALEFRLCGEFAGMPERHLQYLWCDGFTPTRYLLDDAEPRIVGRVWICNGPLQDEWDFTLFLPRTFDSVDVIDWPSLLPASNVTRWLAFDAAGKRIQIEPAAAVPDLA